MRTGDSLPFPNETAPPSSPTVLVAEDEREMRRLTAGALRRAGYRVVEAADGQELVDRVLDPMTGPPDAIVTDVRMPRMSGIDALAIIRRQFPELPAIVTTAFGEVETHEQARDLNARVLDKPFDLDDLLEAVRQILNLQAA